MESFLYDARRVCHQFRNANTNTQPGADSSSSLVKSSEEALRGLEIRLSSRRQKRKYLTIQCILLAQRQGHITPEALAQLAARCSRWAQDVATVEGQRDYILAYGSDFVPLNESLTPYLPPYPVMTPFPVPLKRQAKKRPTTSSSSSCGSGATPVPTRNVRQRTSVC